MNSTLSRVLSLALALAATVLLAAGCGGNQNGGGSDAATWPCPTEWSPYYRGGCAPNVLQCGDGGACATPHAVDDGGTSFWVQPSGAIAGGWPVSDFVPDAGFVVCPTGWSLVNGSCAPEIATDCGDNSAAYPGMGCTHTAASDCPAGPYADPGAEAMGATVVHVDAAASASGADGTTAHPFPTIAQGITAAAGGWVLVAAGTYAESVATAGTLHVVGVCAARVTLTPAAGAVGFNASGGSARLDVRGITLQGGGTGAIAASGATIRLRSVVVQGATGMGVRAGGVNSMIDGADVWVRDTHDLGDGASGWGALAESGGAVTLAQSVVSGSKQIGIAALAASPVTLTDVSVTDTSAVTRGGDGGGLHAQDGGSVSGTNVVLARNANVNAGALGMGSVITLTTVSVTGGVPRADGTFGRGLHAQSGSSIFAVGAFIDGNSEVGASAIGADTVITLENATVSNTRPTAAGAAGRGVYAQDGARLEATGVLIANNRDLGAGAFGSGTVERLNDTIVRGTRAAMDVTQGGGIQAQNGATLVAQRVLVDDNESVGVTALDTGTVVRLDGSIVRGTNARADGTFGRGALAQGGGDLELTNTLVEGNHEFGAVAHGTGAVLSLTDSAVRTTQPQGDGTYGRGVQVERGASGSLTRVLLDQNAELGLASYLTGSTVTMTDVIIVGTVASGRGLGGGAAALGGATITATRVAIQDVHAIGLASLVALDPSLGTFYNASVTATDVFVRRVLPGTVHFTSPIPGETPQSYGLYSGESSSLSATCATLDTGAYGFVDDRGTQLQLHNAAVAGFTAAGGAATNGTASGTLDLATVSYSGNGNDSVVSGVDLPEVH